jgi:seryl-tRNA synthetase
MRPDLGTVGGLACHADGQVTLSGPLLGLEAALERVFLAWALERGAVEHRFSPLLPATALDRVHWFQAFPHLATFPASLPQEDAALRDFADAPPVDRSGALQLTALAPMRHVLTPAACYGTYIHYQGVRLEAPVVVTTRATCFRREAAYRPLARQWAFSMREIVCLGGREAVLEFLRWARGRVDALVDALALPAEWVEATDSFYDAPRNPANLRQRLAAAKKELRFDGDLALASINFHRRYFGEAFDIQADGEPAFSACLAFGLERWMLALLTRFGAEPAGWPNLEDVACRVQC